MTSNSNALPSTYLTFTGADGGAVVAPITPAALTLVINLDLEKDNRGAIVLNKENLQKLRAANLVQLDATSGTYTLNVALVASNAGATPAIAFAPAADGLWRAAPIDAKNLLQTTLGVPTEETSPANALNMQAAAPAAAQQNPYLGGQAAKLSILMHELFLMQESITQLDNVSTQRTFQRAIDNVQTQVEVIDEKTAAKNQAQLGEIAAARMSIMASYTSIGIQAGALATLGAVSGIGRYAGATQSGGTGSKWLETGQYNLKNLIGPSSSLGVLFDKTMQNYINIQLRQSNMASNLNLAVAEKSEAEVQLQLSFIQSSLKEDSARETQTAEQTQQLLDLIASLSRARVEREQSLFRG